MFHLKVKQINKIKRYELKNDHLTLLKSKSSPVPLLKMSSTSWKNIPNEKNRIISMMTKVFTRQVVSKWEVGSYDLEMKSWDSVPGSMGANTSLTCKNFCLIGPSRLRPGWISASGFAVSTVVATIATNQPLLATYNRKKVSTRALNFRNKRLTCVV